MTQMITLRHGSNLQPGLLAGGLAVIAWAAMQQAGAGFEGILGRVMSDPFSRAILSLAVWACAFGMFQICAWRSDRAVMQSSVARWLLARDQVMVVRQEEVAEMWQSLTLRRSAALSYAVWILPTLGFLGTVLGISGAIGEMSGIFSDNADRGAALAQVLGNLEFAFDTTFAGLVGAVPVMGLLIASRLAAETSEQAILAGVHAPQETTA